LDRLELDRLNENEIPNLEKSTKTLQTQVSELKQQTDALEVQCTQLRKDENTARNCSGDVARMDTLQVVLFFTLRLFFVHSIDPKYTFFTFQWKKKYKNLNEISWSVRFAPAGQRMF